MSVRYYEYRCPWCGEKVTPPPERYFNVRRCGACGNKYGFYWSAPIIIWETVAVFGYMLSIQFMMNLLVEEKYFLAILFPILFFFTFPGIYVKKPLKKIEENNISQMRTCPKMIKAKFNVQMPRRYNLINNAIFPICFMNNQGQRMSDYICVSLSEVKTGKNYIICFMSELEYGKKILDIYSEYTKVAIFISKEIYFEGECLL